MQIGFMLTGKKLKQFHIDIFVKEPVLSETTEEETGL